MEFSIPTALVAAYALYCEYGVRQLGGKLRDGSVYFLKVIDFKFRLLVYALNTGIALYNYLTGFDDYVMAAVLMLSMNVVVNISKIVIDGERVIIGNTKVGKADFQLLSLKEIDGKNTKFSFAMTVRKRRFERDLYIQTSQVETLKAAIKKMKGEDKGTHKSESKSEKQVSK